MSRNDITGDNIITDAPTDKFRNGWDLLWGNKAKQAEPKEEPTQAPRFVDSKDESIQGIIKLAAEVFSEYQNSVKSKEIPEQFLKGSPVVPK